VVEQAAGRIADERFPRFGDHRQVPVGELDARQRRSSHPDVTDKLAISVFGLLFEHSPDAAFIARRDTELIVSANVGTATLLMRDIDSLVGTSLVELSYEPGRDLIAAGHYEDVGLRRGDGYPLYVELQVAHVDSPEYGPLAAYFARDTSERRLLERELLAKHTALFTAYADLERAHTELAAAQRALEGRTREVALLAFRAATGELVADIAHHLNNPVGALASTVRRLTQLVPDTPELQRLVARSGQLVQRIEQKVFAIMQATKGGEIQSTFVENLKEMP